MKRIWHTLVTYVEQNMDEKSKHLSDSFVICISNAHNVKYCWLIGKKGEGPNRSLYHKSEFLKNFIQFKQSTWKKWFVC